VAIISPLSQTIGKVGRLREYDTRVLCDPVYRDDRRAYRGNMLERVAGIAMLSLGMSDGFGATSVRVGSAIFGGHGDK